MTLINLMSKIQSFSSRSRSRSPDEKRPKRYSQDSSSSSDREIRMRNKPKRLSRPKASRSNSPEPSYNIKSRSDIRHHVRYSSIRLSDAREGKEIMNQVRQVLDGQFGPVSEVNKLNKNQQGVLTFGVGFKYDEDALMFVKQGGYIKTEHDKKLYAKPTAIFEKCLPMIKEARRLMKEKDRSPSERRKLPTFTRQSKPKKRSSSSSSRRNSHREKASSSLFKQNPAQRYKVDSNQLYKKPDEKVLWVFGLPWTIKGREISQMFDRLPSGPFFVQQWKWVRVRNSGCELMEATFSTKHAQKLLAVRGEIRIGGFPVIITAAGSDIGEDAVRQKLRDYQFRIQYPQKVLPSALFKSLNEHYPVVQMVSCMRLPEGRSNSFTVTLGSVECVHEVRRLYVRQAGVHIQETRGQLVYRPTKTSQLIDRD